jgi:hypothetical protein
MLYALILEGVCQVFLTIRDLPIPDKGRFLTFQGDETRKRG